MPVTSSLSVMVALYCSGSRVSMFAPVEVDVVVVVVPTLLLAVLDALTLTELLLVLGSVPLVALVSFFLGLTMALLSGYVLKAKSPSCRAG